MLGAGIGGKDITQTDENSNARQMPLLERGLRVTGGIFGARSVVNAEIAAPNSAVNKLGDIFDKPPTIKPPAEMVTPNGFRVNIPKPAQTKGGNTQEMRLPDMDEQISGATIKPKWKEKLGEGQDVDDLQETNKYRLGMNNKPQHHVFPQEYRKFFEERGFTGERSIDKFVVTLDEADHQAIHGGANWKLARKVWKEGEWNNKVMTNLKDRERVLGRKLTFEEVKSKVEELMKESGITQNYESWRGGVK